MKCFLIIALAAAVFLGGYQLGRRPDSPDIVGSAAKACALVDRLWRQLPQAPQPTKADTPAAADGSAVIKRNH